jgi:membrane-bound lytic murein transglycosylase A
MRSRIPGILFLFILVSVGIAAWFVLPHKESKGSKLELTPVSLTGLPGWPAFNKRAALAAFQRSCGTILKAQATSELGGYARHVEDWFGVCRAALATNENAARKFFEDHFSAFEVGGDALVTGYYEPLLHGSRTRHDAYQTPVYAAPRDLISVDLGKFRPELKGFPTRRGPNSTNFRHQRAYSSMPTIRLPCSSSTSRAPDGSRWTMARRFA